MFIEKKQNISQGIAIIDIVLSLWMLVYACSQFSHGTDLIPGHFTHQEKLIRFTIYSIFIFVVILIQMSMAIKLLWSAGKMKTEPLLALRCFSFWREWSFVFVFFLILDLVIVISVMAAGNRKITITILIVTEILFRPLGIFIIGSFKKDLEMDLLPSKVVNDVII